MKSFILNTLAAFVSVFISASAFAENSAIHFKPGNSSLAEFVAMASDAIPISINASALNGHSEGPIRVPERKGGMTRDEAIATLLSVLSEDGYTLIEDKDLDLYRVARQRDARDSNLPIFIDGKGLPENDLLVTNVLHTKFAATESVARLLRSFAPANARIIPDEPNHAVLITDVARAMPRYAELIARTDTEANGKAQRENLRRFAQQKAEEREAECPRISSAGGERGIQVALFTLIGLILGFLIRGYAIRRIEGGL